VKNVLPPLCQPTFLLEWVDVNSNLYVYTALQVAKFPLVHLEAGGWYLDCSQGFVPDAEESLYSSLVSSGPEVIELEEDSEEDNPAPLSNDKDVASIKGKSKDKKVASSQVSTHSFTKTSVQHCWSSHHRGWKSNRHSICPCPDLVAAPSHSGATISYVPCKRKAVAPDTSTTSFERSSSISLIENVDMGELIEDLMKTKVSPPAYRRIQEFLTKVRIPLSYFIISFHTVPHSMFF
jgi:hypothetical protein